MKQLNRVQKECSHRMDQNLSKLIAAQPQNHIYENFYMNTEQFDCVLLCCSSKFLKFRYCQVLSILGSFFQAICRSGAPKVTIESNTDAFRKIQNVKFLQLNYTSSTEVMSTFPIAMCTFILILILMFGTCYFKCQVQNLI